MVKTESVSMVMSMMEKTGVAEGIKTVVDSNPTFEDFHATLVASLQFDMRTWISRLPVISKTDIIPKEEEFLSMDVQRPFQHIPEEIQLNGEHNAESLLEICDQEASEFDTYQPQPEPAE